MPFIRQDDAQRDPFIEAADYHLTGNRWHPEVTPDLYEFVARHRTWLASEGDAHAGQSRRFAFLMCREATRAGGERVRHERLGDVPSGREEESGLHRRAA